jgi:hypothetical protein
VWPPGLHRDVVVASELRLLVWSNFKAIGVRTQNFRERLQNLEVSANANPSQKSRYLRDKKELKKRFREAAKKFERPLLLAWLWEQKKKQIDSVVETLKLPSDFGDAGFKRSELSYLASEIFEKAVTHHHLIRKIVKLGGEFDGRFRGDFVDPEDRSNTPFQLLEHIRPFWQLLERQWDFFLSTPLKKTRGNHGEGRE